MHPESTLARGVVARAAATAAALSGMAAYVERCRQHAECLNPPIGRLLRVDDSVVHVIAAGKGLPVVMIHGAGSMVQDFLHSLMVPVARHWRGIAFDRPGYGYSSRQREHDWTLRRQAAVLRRAMLAMGVERAVVVGHSLGTGVALALALDHPDSVAGLVLLSGDYYPDARPDFAPMLAMAVPGLSALTTRTIGPILSRPLLPYLRRRSFAPNPVPPLFDEWFPQALALRPSHLRATARDLLWLRRSLPSVMPLYRYVRQPTMIMAGAEDRMVDTARQSVRLAADIPHAGLAILPGIGHMPHHVVPDAVIAAIADIATRADLDEG